ncbi:Tryptophan halogenase [Sphingomonas gellani]|uniref:Tryptophan halogenase n=1 Tax=Sphingomonas gellani TaxID=1166340 RepID=A0A1H8CTS0_9SPHN|nr:tryptophan halogenase family protein [Sphingomonas gellani]SEM98543.1 Tryptophan halogenase [Sphingomonas gellani]
MAPPDRIVILGGGTAGWMAACLMARAWPASAITVVEAPDIPIVGVGEGSTPQLRAFFDRLGIPESTWMAACHATYKVGIAFRGWSDRPGHQSYFHPFAGPADLHTEAAFHHSTLARRLGHDVEAHPDRFFLSTRLASQRLAPLAPAHFPFGPGYGYHFDAHLVGAFLAEWATARGVTHLRRRVEDVLITEGGDIASVLVEDGEAILGDLFVDASGFGGVLIQQALGESFLPFADNLFCDRAVVVPTPADPAGPEVHTTATALNHGWAWRIPLTTRTGNGYVYASRYVSPDGAAAELRAHLLLPDDAPVRHLSMKVGRVDRSWVGNCLAVGLAQGFIEPLEATALHMVQATVEGFIDALEAHGFTTAGRDDFNARIARRYEGIRDYIVAHYRMNQRADTDFWRDNAGHDRLSDTLKAMMTAWFTGRDLPAEVQRLDIGGYYAPLSWGCLFAGYGVFPEPARLHAAPSPVDLPAIDRLLDRCLLNFRPQTAVLPQRAGTPRTSREIA